MSDIQQEHTEEQALDRLMILFRKYRNQKDLADDEKIEYCKLFEFVFLEDLR